MTEPFMSKVTRTAALVVLAAIATCTVSCSSKEEQPPGMNLPSMQMSPAAPGSCRIDAIKMCRVIEGYAAGSSSQPVTGSVPSSYTSSITTDSVEFQIPAGQNIKLTCYSDPQHGSVYRADATAESALTGNSVEYMKQRGFCIKK